MTQVSWDPRAEEDKLEALAKVTAAMHHGRPAFDRRVSELSGGFSSRGEGGGSGDGLTQAEAGAESALAGQSDTGMAELEAWERDIARSLDIACRAWERYTRLVQPRDGVEKLADPGCELCALVPAHWCPVYGTRVIMTEPKSKRARPQLRTLMLCQWCFTFTWPSRAGRLPEPEEVEAHAEGRRVNWRGGAQPRLIEVPCPECHDENREARRSCSTCGHAGKVLKVAS